MYFCCFAPNFILLVLKDYLASPDNKSLYDIVVLVYVNSLLMLLDMNLRVLRGTKQLTVTYLKTLTPIEHPLLSCISLL